MSIDIESKEEIEALKTELLEDGEGFSSDGESHHEKATEFMGADACSGLCSSMFDLLAARKGEQWHLKPEESQSLGGALDAVLAKYIPAGLDKYSAETALILVAIGIVMPRMSQGGEHGAS